jgi:hypothetical protein
MVIVVVIVVVVCQGAMILAFTGKSMAQNCGHGRIRGLCGVLRCLRILQDLHRMGVEDSEIFGGIYRNKILGFYNVSSLIHSGFYRGRFGPLASLSVTQSGQCVCVCVSLCVCVCVCVCVCERERERARESERETENGREGRELLTLIIFWLL